MRLGLWEGAGEEMGWAAAVVMVGGAAVALVTAAGAREGGEGTGEVGARGEGMERRLSQVAGVAVVVEAEEARVGVAASVVEAAVERKEAGSWRAGYL